MDMDINKSHDLWKLLWPQYTYLDQKEPERENGFLVGYKYLDRFALYGKPDQKTYLFRDNAPEFSAFYTGYGRIDYRETMLEVPLYNGRAVIYRSTSRRAYWLNRELYADKKPTANNTHGIYAASTPQHPELDIYDGNAPFGSHTSTIPTRVMVRLLLGGRVIQTDNGIYRAEYAVITREI